MVGKCRKITFLNQILDNISLHLTTVILFNKILGDLSLSEPFDGSVFPDALVDLLHLAGHPVLGYLNRNPLFYGA